MRQPFRTIPVAMGAMVLVLAALGADEPKSATKTKLVNAEGVTFRVPVAWKSTKPTQRFRKAYVKVDPAEGDKDPAELVVTAFFADGGGVEANVARWKGMFKPEGDEAAEPKVEQRQVRNVEITVVEVGGRYVAPESPGSPKKFNKPGYRLFGAIVPGKSGTYFFKMVGPDKTMKEARDAFDDMVGTITMVEP